MVDPSPPTRTRGGGVAIVLASLSLALSLLSCGVLALTTDFDPLPVQSPPQTASAAEVEAVAHVTLPPGTVLLSAVYTNGLETRLSAKFRIPRAALDSFLAASSFTTALTPGLRAVTRAHDVAGGDTWHPETAVSVSGLEEATPTADDTYRSLLLDLDVPETVTVYLYSNRP